MEPATSTQAKRSVIAVVLAAGSGRRMAEAVPKQLADLAGRSVLAHSLRAFQGASAVDEIIVVSRPDLIGSVKAIASAEAIDKLSSVVAGGTTRSDSSVAALAAVGFRPAAKVLIHDAARPLIDQATIDAVINGLDESSAVAPAIAAADTVITVGGDHVVDIPDRSTMMLIQTPQGFAWEVLRDAYALAAADPAFTATDDCGVIKRYRPDIAIRIVPGARDNIKLTHPADLAVAESLLRERQSG